MSRYNFLKIIGLRSNKNFSIISGCNNERSFSTKENGVSDLRLLHNRPKSNPSLTSENDTASKLENNCCKPRQDVNLKKFYHKINKDQKPTVSNNQRKLSTREKEVSEEESETSNKYQEFDTYKQQKYELEAARPKRNPSRLIFNVFSYVTKEVDLNDHLQPNNLKPYGAQDNVYLPILMSNKNSCLIYTNPSYLPPGRDSLSKNNPKLNKETNKNMDKNY